MSLAVAFFLAGGVIGGSIFLLYHDKNIAGFSVLIAGAATLIATVLSNRRGKRDTSLGSSSEGG
jgi:hypothetical protein